MKKVTINGKKVYEEGLTEKEAKNILLFLAENKCGDDAIYLKKSDLKELELEENSDWFVGDGVYISKGEGLYEILYEKGDERFYDLGSGTMYAIEEE